MEEVIMANNAQYNIFCVLHKCWLWTGGLNIHLGITCVFVQHDKNNITAAQTAALARAYHST